MRKVIILCLTTILLVLTMAGFANAEPANLTEALSAANNELSAKYYGIEYFRTQNIQGKPINEANWAKSRLFTYGTPQEASPGKNDFDPVRNQYRYHGYTMNNEKYTNTFFRNDTTDTLDVNSANWISKPWEKTYVQNFVTNVMHEPKLESNNPFNNDPALLKSIILGMENVTQYNPYIKFKRDNRQWQEYVHILQPPTKYTFGMGRLFHMKNGQIWYLTIPLTPLIMTEEPNLVAVEINTGLQQGQKAKPGQKLTGKFTVKNESEQDFNGIPVGVWHQNTPVKLFDPIGRQVDGYTDLKAGEVKEFYFDYTVEENSTLKGAIDHEPETENTVSESNENDNVLEVKVPLVQDNLWVEIIDYTKEAQVGGTATVRARIHNERGELLTSRLVWKVNGVIMKDIPNYDIIGTLENSLTFTMPKDAAVVTVEINPDRNRPADETSYEDNKATCTVNPIAVAIPPDSDSNRLKIKISAPSRVKAFTKWKYTVTVTTNYPPPPPPPPGVESPKPPTITMNMNATGQNIDFNIGYRIDDGYQKIIPVNKTDKKVFSSGWGKNTHTFTYEYPATGIYGKPVTVTIKATASSSKGQSASDTAIVKIDPHPIPQTELQLIK